MDVSNKQKNQSGLYLPISCANKTSFIFIILSSLLKIYLFLFSFARGVGNSKDSSTSKQTREIPSLLSSYSASSKQSSQKETMQEAVGNSPHFEENFGNADSLFLSKKQSVHLHLKALFLCLDRDI